MLQGWKTYLTAGIIVVLAVIRQFFGIEVPGFDLDLTAAITVAAGLIFARQGVKADVKKEVAKIETEK